MSARGETATLLEQLRRHYIKPGPMPGGVFVPECGINGGAQTRADALYVGFTSTSGRILVGHELKVSRSDWRKELDSAGKADFWADNCHEWYIVAPGPEIVPKEEIPHGWGLMYPSSRTKTRMQIVVKAVTHAERVPNWNATRSILARLDTLQAQHDHQVIEKARAVAREEGQRQRDVAQREAERSSMTPETQSRLGHLDRLEKLLGRELVGWLNEFDPAGEKITAEQAAGALRLLAAMRSMDLGNDRFAVERLTRAGHALLEGLEEYREARQALTALAGGGDLDEF